MKAFLIAFSMYSRIPMPHVKWEERSMRLAMCFFPMIGIVIGGGLLLLHLLCVALSLGAMLQGALFCALPLLITGGIHLDGYCDTVDALCSRQPKAKKLEILKDPHIGAFGVLFACLYFVLQFALFGALDSWQQVGAAAILFVLSRANSALALMLLRNAKKTGTAHAFASAAQKKVVSVTMLCWIGVCMVGLGILSLGMMGLMAGTVLLVWAWYRWMSYRQFGGITGDLAGWFLQMMELFGLSAIVLSAKLGFC